MDCEIRTHLSDFFDDPAEHAAAAALEWEPARTDKERLRMSVFMLRLILRRCECQVQV